MNCERFISGHPYVVLGYADELSYLVRQGGGFDIIYNVETGIYLACDNHPHGIESVYTKLL